MSKPAWMVLGWLMLSAVPAGTAMAQAIGRASAGALTTARAKENAMREARGPESVTLNADEMASLVEANLDNGARRALDSIAIRLDPGRLTLQAMLVTAQFGTEYLGPLALMLDRLEPLTVAGPAWATRAGLITWQPDSLVIRAFALPQAAIPRLVSRLTGRTDGTIAIPVPPTVRLIRILSTGVTFSRRAS